MKLTLLLVITSIAFGQQVPGRIAIRSGTTLPTLSNSGTNPCLVGELFFKSDAAPGSNIYGITDAATCTWTAQAGGGGGTTTRAYTFQGITQSGVSAWNLNYTSLTNMVFGTTDATHLRANLVVTANTTGSAMWSVTPVTTTNPSVLFVVEARSTDGTNAGSMALSYACVAAGSSVDNPTTTALTAVSLTTISSTKSVYSSTQSITCSGTTSAPADLYVFWTPTAPSGGTLTLLRMSLTY